MPPAKRLAEFDFDPAADIALDRSGCWRWNSAKPRLHAWLQEYFESRKEDGELECRPVAADAPLPTLGALDG